MWADSSEKLIVHAQRNSLSITEINFVQCLKAGTILRPLKAIFHFVSLENRHTTVLALQQKLI